MLGYYYKESMDGGPKSSLEKDCGRTISCPLRVR